MKPRTRRDYSAQCDTLFARIVRQRGVCEIQTDTECSGVLQCCHGFSRRYRATRWDFDNSWCGCARHHQWWSAHPIEWDNWMHQALGNAGYHALRRRALVGERPDLKTLLAELKQTAMSGSGP